MAAAFPPGPTTPRGARFSSEHAGGADSIHVAYNDADGSRTVTNPLGQQTVYKFSALQGVPKATEEDRLATAGVAAATRTFTYDANGYIASATDWNGNLTTYTNDARGRPTTIVVGAGTPQARTTTITNHATFHLPVRIVMPGFDLDIQFRQPRPVAHEHAYRHDHDYGAVLDGRTNANLDVHVVELSARVRAITKGQSLRALVRQQWGAHWAY